VDAGPADEQNLLLGRGWSDGFVRSQREAQSARSLRAV
jgi:hypothetical protein